MASLAIVFAVLLYPQRARAGDVSSRSADASLMTVNMPQSNNWMIGMTLDNNLNSGKPSPFTTESEKVLESAWEDPNLEWQQQGTFSMSVDIVSSQSEAIESLGVSGSLEVSYLMFSGDAHMNFAKENIQSDSDVSVIVRATAEGRKKQLSLFDTNGLALKEGIDDTVLTGDDFAAMYGEYLIVGFEYGGEVTYHSKHSAKNSEDKMAIEGGLSMSFSKAGFSISGGADTKYDKSDISKSVETNTDWEIRPNAFGSEALDGLITSLNALSFGDGPDNPNLYESMAQNAQDLLSRDADPIKAIVVPLSSISAVAELMLNNPDAQDTIPFMKFLNEMYQSVTSLLKRRDLVETQWRMIAPESVPVNDWGNWQHILKGLLREMEVINTVKDINDGSTKFLASNPPWDTDVLTAKSFIDITTMGLERQFDDAIMEPYRAMLAANPDAAPLSGASLYEMCDSAFELMPGCAAGYYAQFGSNVIVTGDCNHETKCNNGGVSCGTYCDQAYNREAPVGSTCINAIKTNTGGSTGCSDINAPGWLAGLICSCMPPSLPGGGRVSSCDQCALLCDSSAGCVSYECSPNELNCNLNDVADPSKFYENGMHGYKDYVFCTKFLPTETTIASPFVIAFDLSDVSSYWLGGAVVLCVALLLLNLCRMAYPWRNSKAKYAQVVAECNSEDFTDNEAKPINADVGI